MKKTIVFSNKLQVICTFKYLSKTENYRYSIVIKELS